MRIVTSRGIQRASIHWSTRRKKTLSPDKTYPVPTADILRIGGVWNTDESWIERARDEKYKPVIEDMSKDGWCLTKPATVSIGTNGFVTLIDGNHRLTLVLMHHIKVSFIPTKFYFFDVGQPVHPTHPSTTWDGKNLYFICYPRGSCGRCGSCRNTKPAVKEMLSCYGI
jgi:hypothetical protein